MARPLSPAVQAIVAALTDTTRELFDALLPHIEATREADGQRWGRVHLPSVKAHSRIRGRAFAGTLNGLRRAGLYEAIEGSAGLYGWVRIA